MRDALSMPLHAVANVLLHPTLSQHFTRLRLGPGATWTDFAAGLADSKARVGQGFHASHGQFAPPHVRAGPGRDGWAALSRDPREVRATFAEHPDAPAIVFVIFVDGYERRFSVELRTGALREVATVYERAPR